MNPALTENRNFFPESPGYLVRQVDAGDMGFDDMVFLYETLAENHIHLLVNHDIPLKDGSKIPDEYRQGGVTIIPGVEAVFQYDFNSAAILAGNLIRDYSICSAVEQMLTNYSDLGGTHHCVLTYGAKKEDLSRLGRLMSWEVTIV